MSSSLLDKALELAVRDGLAVFPCSRAKTPLKGSHGFHDASVDPDEIKRMFANGRAASISIPTGKVTGFDVLDVDIKDGKDGTRHLPQNWMDLCPVIIQTPSGGYHAPFRTDGVGTHQFKLNGKAAGLEWRGDGGYMTVFPGREVIKGEWPCDPSTLPVMPPELRYEAFAGEQASAARKNVIDFPAPDGLVEKVKQHAGKGTSTDAADLPAKATVEEVITALSVIPADCPEDEWWRIAAALYDHFDGSEEGFEIFHAWSATGGASYKGKHDCRNKWQHSASKKDIHIATPFHFANQYDPGWRAGVKAKPDPHRNPNPRPIPNLTRRPRNPPTSDWPILGEAAYHGIIGEVVRTIEPESEADPVAILIQLIVAVGNMIGRQAYYQVESDRHHPNLFAAAVGDTSKARKGTSWGRVREVCYHADPEWVLHRIGSGLSSGEGLIHQVRDRVTKIKGRQRKSRRPRRQRQAVHGPRGRAVRLAQGHGAPGQHHSPLFRKAWDGGDLQTLTRSNSLKATEPARVVDRSHNHRGASILPHPDRRRQRLRQQVPVLPRSAVQGAADGRQPRRRDHPRTRQKDRRGARRYSDGG